MKTLRISCEGINETRVLVDGVEQKDLEYIRFTHHAGERPHLELSYVGMPK